MSLLLFKAALFFVLLATGGFIVYLVREQKLVYRWSYRNLLAGFICHTLFFSQQYYTLGVVPVLNMKSALSFFSWSIIGAYLILQMRNRTGKVEKLKIGAAGSEIDRGARRG